MEDDERVMVAEIEGRGDFSKKIAMMIKEKRNISLLKASKLLRLKASFSFHHADFYFSIT